MIDGFVRVAAVTPWVSVGDPAANADHIEETVRNAARLGARIIVTPELSITGYTCGELFLQDTLIYDAQKALLRLVARSKGKEEVVIVGVPFPYKGKLYNVAAVYSDGTLHGLVPKTHLPNYGEFYELRHFAPAPKHLDFVSIDVAYADDFDEEMHPLIHIVHDENIDDAYFDDDDDIDFDMEDIPFGTDIIFRCQENPELAFAVEICEDLWASETPSQRHVKMGAAIIANLSAGDETIGKAHYRRLLTCAQSGKLLCGYIYANAGVGESTTDMTFSGHSVIAENGAVLAEAKPFSRSNVVITEIDVQGLMHDRRYMNTFMAASEKVSDGYAEMFFSQPSSYDSDEPEDYGKVIRIGLADNRSPDMYRFIDPHPFTPADTEKRKERCEEILSIQVSGLATRLISARAKAAVVGISGGLDSTLALLVTVRAAEAAGLAMDSVLAVTMPSFGTTERTKKNAYSLADALGVQLREIAVSDTVRAHLESIGHDEDVHDVVYENAQARVRTLTLMDIANATNGLVVGTGDLSELALGWATYNGDHMSMYGVNAGVPKTLVRHIIKYVADENPALNNVLNDILDTPVSPELLPPEDGDISQKTEEIVGPYELHDFFLYHMVRFGRSPRIIFNLAKIAFAEQYDSKTILDWILVFTKRFFANQFKRSALPDGPKVGSVTLSPRGDWRMPSDAQSDAWVSEIESIKI